MCLRHGPLACNFFLLNEDFMDFWEHFRDPHKCKPSFPKASHTLMPGLVREEVYEKKQHVIWILDAVWARNLRLFFSEFPVIVGFFFHGKPLLGNLLFLFPEVLSRSKEWKSWIPRETCCKFAGCPSVGFRDTKDVPFSPIVRCLMVTFLWGIDFHLPLWQVPRPAS